MRAATAGRGLVATFAIVCLPFGAGYFLSYLYRSINAVIGPHLATELTLGPAELGLLTSAYFLGFALFQLPLGVLLDRYGPRRVQSVLLLVAGTGALVFSLGQGAGTLLAGRALIGVGVAGGLMASFKAITLWFPQHRWPLINGIFMGIGGLGAMAATTPVQAALEIASWRAVFQGLALATALVALTIFLVVPERDARGAGAGGRADGERERPRLREQVRGLLAIYGDLFFWRLAPVSFITLATGMAIQGLWAGPWLRDIGGLDPEAVADHLLVLTAAMTAGFVATGVISDLVARLGVDKPGVVGWGAVLMMAIMGLILGEVAPRGYWVWALFGFFSNLTVLAYPALSEHFTVAFAGRANTALNLLLFLSAFGLQYLMGQIIELWPRTGAGGYHPDAYRAAFGTALGLIVLAWGWYLLAGALLRRRGPGGAARTRSPR